MKLARIIFNKKGKWHWYENEFDIALELKEKDLNKEWFVAEVLYPDYPNYDSWVTWPLLMLIRL